MQQDQQHHTALSADGTPIAYEVHGEGPTLVLVAGIFCTRATLRPLAEALADRLRVAVYDRRGRGDSGGAGPVPGPTGAVDVTAAVTDEVADLAAVVDALGGEAAVYGHSSGAGVALQAAAAGVAISRLVLHEPPYGGDDAESRAAATALATDVGVALAAGRPGAAISRFLGDMGMPTDVLAATAADPAMVAVAPTMTADLAVMGDADGGTVPVGLAGSIAVPTLVVAGDASPAFFRTAAERLVGMLPDARLAVLEGHDHGAPADAVAPVVARFVTG